tara:strand:+ start:3295 stop:4554 length:1260 start_codon:yes stop_codon:yes gene_type:complete
MTVLIAGGGIGGLTLALSCQQLNIPFIIFEKTKTLEPLGVGINLQPNAVRELADLNLKQDLYKIGVETQEFGLFSKKGLKIWTEPRGLAAGYNEPQFSVHRGQLQKLLYNKLIERADRFSIKTGCSVNSFENLSSGVKLNCFNKRSEQEETFSGSILVGCDGINSQVRKQMYPNEQPPIWNGAVLWRGITSEAPFRTKASMVMIGHDTQRFVSYPISGPDSNGRSIINWIAELKFDPSNPWPKGDWSKKVNKSKFIDQFKDWAFEWINPHQLISNAGDVFEYPMVDREPLEKWTFDNTTILGDAAHPTYPVGSSGASQAIIDSRKLVYQFKNKGLNNSALLSYENEMRPLTNKITLTNRQAGPDALLQVVEDRCDGQFIEIENVITKKELKQHADKYKMVAGINIERLNNSKGILSQYF